MARTSLPSLAAISRPACSADAAPSAQLRERLGAGQLFRDVGEDIAQAREQFEQALLVLAERGEPAALVGEFGVDRVEQLAPAAAFAVEFAQLRRARRARG